MNPCFKDTDPQEFDLPIYFNGRQRKFFRNFKTVMERKMAQMMTETMTAGNIAELDSNINSRILVVDDYDANIMIAGSYLENFGYEYDVAKNGLDALNKIRNGEYLAILMDIQMPELDGMETTMLIRNYEHKQKRGRQPIIAMTAHTLAGDCQACFAAGMDAYLSKPFNPNELQAMLSHFSSMRHA